MSRRYREPTIRERLLEDYLNTTGGRVYYPRTYEVDPVIRDAVAREILTPPTPAKPPTLLDRLRRVLDTAV